MNYTQEELERAKQIVAEEDAKKEKEETKKKLLIELDKSLTRLDIKDCHISVAVGSYEVGATYMEFNVRSKESEILKKALLEIRKIVVNS